jgi:HEAT repeat protein/TolA-binding protein
MNLALRLTTMLLWLPAAEALAQGPPPTPRPPREPRAVEPRVIEPRPPREPRMIEPPLLERHLEPFMKLQEVEPMLHFDMKMDMLDAKRFEKDAMRFEKDAMRFEMDAKRDALLESRLSDLSWKTDALQYSKPRFGGDRDREAFTTSPRAPWLQGDPADSLYKSARELLNGGEWRRAASAFASLPQRFPNSGYAADAMYWQAFALYRIGGTDDLKTALTALETMRTKYPSARSQSQSDAVALMARIRGTLASRGDRQAEEQLRRSMAEQGTQCDREDQAVRSEAMKSLAQTDPASLPSLVKRVLAKKDACSAPLRRTAVYLIGSGSDSEAPAILRDVALNDPEAEVRSTALQYLARSPSDIAVNTLEEVLKTSTDQSVLRTAARALAANPSSRARQAVRALIERSDAPVQLRIEAVGGFENSERTTDEDAAYLRNVYPKIDNPRVKARIARVIGHLGGEQNDAWLLTLMRNNDEPLEVRTAALERVASRNMPIADAVRLYGNVADRDLRSRLISVYRQRKEPEATDKLIDIAKNDTDYNLRRQAIGALVQKNDPRATKLLMEIVDK